MTAFDQAWDIAKDFFFDRGVGRFDEEDLGGGMKRFKSILGRYERPLVNAMRNNYDPSSRYMKPEFFTPGKHVPVVLPRTHTMEYHDPLGYAPISVDNFALAGPEGLNHYVGVNLSGINQPGRTEEQMIEDIASALLHEHGHAAIDNEMTRIYFDEAMRARSAEEAQRAHDKFAAGHEFGAYTLQNPGGEDAERSARFDLISHPNWRAAQTPETLLSIPKAYINRDRRGTE